MPESAPGLVQLLMTRVRQASTEISIASHGFEFDAFGQMLLSELEYACQRGLRVRCLLDASGSAGFIADHPALFTALETRFRVHRANATPVSLLAFDRNFVLLGDFRLCESIFSEEKAYQSVGGEPASRLALDFDANWNAAREPGLPAG